jgi:hypothetical protein
VLAFVVVFALLSIGGAWLTLRGLFPKRQGETAFCRKCSYNLTGLDLKAADARCPECGAALSQIGAITIGARHIRVRRAALGLAILLFGLAPLAAMAVGKIWHVDWYTDKPTRWVLQDAASQSQFQSHRAFRELARRYTAGGLNSGQLASLAEAALSEQGRNERRPFACGTAADLLDRLRRNGHLSDAQTQRFFDQMVTTQLLVRSPIVSGQPSPAAIRLEFRGGSGVYRNQVGICETKIDGSVSSISWTYDAHDATFWRPPLEAELSLSAVGEHTVEVMVACQVRGPSSGGEFVWQRAESAIFHTRRVLKALVEVLNEESPDLLQMRHSPELDAAVANSVQLRPMVVVLTPTPPELALFELKWEAMPWDTLPIGLAFDVFAKFSDTVVSLGQRCSSAGQVVVSLTYPRKLPERITIIMRASKAAALASPDLFEIWDGELRFEDIPAYDQAGKSIAYHGLARRVDRAEQYPAPSPRMRYPALKPSGSEDK